MKVYSICLKNTKELEFAIVFNSNAYGNFVAARDKNCLRSVLNEISTFNFNFTIIVRRVLN